MPVRIEEIKKDGRMGPQPHKNPSQPMLRKDPPHKEIKRRNIR
jgi:hypothetical protein